MASRGKVQPHPPTAPANQSFLKIQRTRVRMVSGRSAGKPDNSSNGSHRDSDGGDRATVDAGHAQDSRSGDEDSILSLDEKLAVHVLRNSSTAHVEPTNEEKVYSYRSSPKSAEHRRPSLPVSMNTGIHFSKSTLSLPSGL